jgi:type VI secretion system protein ImpK
MRLVDCFTDIVAYTLILVRGGEPGKADFDVVRGTIERINTRSQALMASFSIPEEHYELARFAVFAWVDEAIMGSSWPGKTQWQKEHLQLRHFQTADAGELFFQRLNGLGLHQMDVREVFYLCLALGFTGQYCNKGDEVLLDQLRTSNLKLLTGSSVQVPSLASLRLMPDTAPPDEDGVTGVKRFGAVSPFTVMAVLIPAGIYGLMYFVYVFILGNIGDALLTRIP